MTNRLVLFSLLDSFSYRDKMSLIISVNAFSKASGKCRAWVPISPGLRLRREPGFQPAFISPAGQVWEASPGTQQSVPAPVTGHNSSPSGRAVASLPVPCPQQRRQRLGGRFGGCIRRGLPPNLLTKAPQGAAASAAGEAPVSSICPCSQAISCSDLGIFRPRGKVPRDKY